MCVRVPLLLFVMCEGEESVRVRSCVCIFASVRGGDECVRGGDECLRCGTVTGMRARTYSAHARRRGAARVRKQITHEHSPILAVREVRAVVGQGVVGNQQRRARKQGGDACTRRGRA